MENSWEEKRNNMNEKKTIQALTEIVDGKLLAIASDDSVDRMGDSLDINRWNLKNFKKNPVLLAGHQNSPEFVIGVAKNIRVEGNKLLFEPMFHGITEVARNIRDMFQEKVLTAWSVGFIPGALMNPDDKSVKNELLEVSAVAVPANANALTSAKAYGEDVKKEVKNWVDKSVEEKEETNETIAEELSDDEKMKKKYELFGEVDKIIWAFYKVYMNKDIEVEKFNSLLDETIKLLASVAKGKKAVDGENIKIEAIDDKIKELNSIRNIEVEVKEGKVISKKNRDKISSSVEQMKQTIVTLEKLLALTETPKEKSEETVEKIQVEKNKVVEKMPPSEKELALRFFKKIAGNSNLALNKLNKK